MRGHSIATPEMASGIVDPKDTSWMASGLHGTGRLHGIMGLHQTQCVTQTHTKWIHQEVRLHESSFCCSLVISHISVEGPIRKCWPPFTEQKHREGGLLHCSPGAPIQITPLLFCKSLESSLWGTVDVLVCHTLSFSWEEMKRNTHHHQTAIPWETPQQEQFPSYL